MADDVVKASQLEQAAKKKALELAKTTTGAKSVVDMISTWEASGSGDAPEPGRSMTIRWSTA